MADHSHTELPRPSAPKKPGVIANVLAIVGFVILIIIILWGLLHLLSLTTPWVSDLFTSDVKKSSIVVSAPAQVQAGSPLSISWKHDTTTRGTYALLYKCEQGLTITVGNRQLPCGAAYTLGNATSAITMIPTLSGKTSIASNLTVLFIPSAAGTTGPEASGSATVQILANSEVKPPVVTTPTTPSTPTTPKPTNPTPVTPKPVTPSSPADLDVRIIAVGVIDPYTGAFVQRAPYHASETAAVQFDIANIGGSNSGSYTFQAQIPTSQPYTYSSLVQPSLAPGSHVVNTLRFSPATNGTFSVQVMGQDSNSSNNYASQWITGVAVNQYPGYVQY